MSTLPFYNPNREMESNLTKLRLDKGLTIKELCKLSGITTNHYARLNNGLLSPILHDGQVHPAAFKLSTFLNEDLSEIFPRYFCSLNNLEASNEEIIENVHSGSLDFEFENPEMIIEKKLINDLFLYKIFTEFLKPREAKVLFCRYWLDETFSEIAIRFNVSMGRIQQCERKAINKLRYHLNNSKLRNEIV